MANLIVTVCYGTRTLRNAVRLGRFGAARIGRCRG
jgi:hypothetical protein